MRRDGQAELFNAARRPFHLLLYCWWNSAPSCQTGHLGHSVTHTAMGSPGTAIYLPLNLKLEAVRLLTIFEAQGWHLPYSNLARGGASSTRRSRQRSGST